MSKVIFEFDSEFEERDIDLVVNRDSLAWMLYEVQELYNYVVKNDDLTKGDISLKLYNILEETKHLLKQ
jgi:hypothetical protein